MFTHSFTPDPDLIAQAGDVKAVVDVVTERARQTLEFTADQDDLLTPPEWIARLAKHLGRAVTHDHLAFRRAMVVVGAIALAAIEWHDRRYPQ